MERRISDGADVIESYIGEARREWARRARQRAPQADREPYALALQYDERGFPITEPMPRLAKRVRRLLSD